MRHLKVHDRPSDDLEGGLGGRDVMELRAQCEGAKNSGWEGIWSIPGAGI